MRTLEEIRNINRKKYSALSDVDMTAPILTQEQYEKGRKEYEEFVEPISQRVFARQVINRNL